MLYSDQLKPGVSGGILEFFTRNAVAANLMMALLLLGGYLAARSLTAQVFPTIDPGVLTVSVAYPGATPSEVEEGITRRVEEALAGIDGIERIESRASENYGAITIELKDFVDEMKVRDDVETAVESLIEFPPEDAEEVEIERSSLLSDVLTLVVSAEGDDRALRKATDNLELELLALPDVTLVSKLGAKPYEISIEVREENLRQFDLTIGQVAAAIRSSSINLSSGQLKTEAGDLLLRTNNKGYKGKDFENIVIRSNPNGSILRLRDVADIRDGFAEMDLIQTFNGQRSLLVRVQKSEPEDAILIASKVNEFLETYDPGAGVQIQVWDDQTRILEDRLNLLIRNGILGFALVFLFLVVMLDLRLATWVAMGVPISFMGAILFFDFFGVNINMVSLFALIVVLGLVVDDAVVVGENIITEQQIYGPGYASTLKGVREVMSPVTIGVLTTMVAFAPILFVTGEFGQIMGELPIIVILVLTFSLIEVFAILPAHLAHGKPWSQGALKTFQDGVARRVEGFRDNRLIPLVEKAVTYRKTTFYLIGLPFLFSAVVLLGTGAVRFIFFPDLESNSIRASLQFPVGTPFQTTKNATDRLIDAAYRVNEEVGGTSFKALNVTVGGRNSSRGGPGGGSSMSMASNVSSVQIELNSEPMRTLSAGELEKLWRQKVGLISGVESLSFRSNFFSIGPDVAFELAHQEDEVLFAAVDALKAAYRDIQGAYDIQDSFNLGKRQYDISLTPAGEAAGLSPADIARQLRGNFFGQEVQRIQRGRDELKVMVRYPESQRQSQRDLYQARVRLSDGTLAPLSSVARLSESRSFSTIKRVDGLRIVTVSTEIDTDLITPTEANDLVEKTVLPRLKKDFPGLQARIAGSGRDQSRDLESIGNNMGFGLLVIWLLLASQLRSYIAQPLVILSAIPFGFAGAVVGHFLLGYNISFISIFGMVALTGVVINDSLVLVDKYNRFRRTTEMTPTEAVVEAARRRFRAIFLTTSTTALGLTPMLFESSTQAAFLKPMAVSIATGIVFASLIILFLVPCLIVMLSKFEETREEEDLSAIAINSG